MAILARHCRIPFYVCAPLSTLDLGCAGGADIHIEERPPEEVTERWYARRMAPQGVKVLNPAFDVTEGIAHHHHRHRAGRGPPALRGGAAASGDPLTS